MALDLLLIAFGIVFPGAAAIKVWDFVARIEDRSRESLYGLGAFIGGLPYVILQIAGFTDLKKLFGPEGKLNLNVVFATQSLVLFVSVTIILVGAAWAVSRMAHSCLGQRFASWAWDRTLGGSNWAEVSSNALGRWVNITTKDGREWCGFLKTIPDTDSGHLVLAWPEFHDVDKDVWLGGNDSVILPVKDLLYLLILKEVTDGNGRTEEQASLRGGQQAVHGGQQSEAADRTVVATPTANESHIPTGSVGDSANQKVEVAPTAKKSS